MGKKTLIFGMAALFIFGLMNFNMVINSSVPKGDWVKLGSKKVTFKVDKDVINVGANDGRFAKLKVVVTNGNLNMHRMVVHFGNKTKEVVELRHNFAKGSGSRVIDLKGKKRIIKKIVFWYDTKNKANKRATVTVFGRH